MPPSKGVAMQSETHEDESSTVFNNGADNGNYGDNEKPTPLPIFPLLSLFLIQMAEPITAAVIYPFINQFVRETGITGGDEKKTGYYAGIIESAFFLAECLCVVQWGYLSDRYGRRPILLCAPIGLAASMLIFGMSTTFWPLVISRCLQGIFNGNIGVTKTSIAELTDASNRGDAYAYQPIVWSIGVTTGPIIGGVLSNPATRWPDTLGRISYLRTHPYFLPCFVAALFAFATFVFVYFALKETLPSLVAQEKALKHLQDVCDDGLCADPTEETRLIDSGDCQNYGTEVVATSCPADMSEVCTAKDTERSGAKQSTGILQIIFTRPILLTLLNHAFLTFLDMCYFTLIPLVYSTPVKYGGLGLDPFRIGVILATFGFCNSILQAKLLGGLIRKYGARNRAGGVDGLVTGCIVVQLCSQSMIYMAYGSLQVVIIESVPEGGPMGTINGVAQMLGSGMRTLAPTFSSSLFSVSLQRKLAGGNMVYYIMMVITMVGIRYQEMTTQIDEETPLLERNGKQRPTPLPVFQFSIVLFLQLAEPLTSQVIYPFAPQLIRDLGITNGRESQVGYYVGLMQSIFFLTQAFTVLHWSRISDRVGRKPIILSGLFGLSLSMYCFGLSRTFWGVVVSRSLNGALNGNIGVIKSMMAEMTDSTNISQATWSTGGTLGPIIGGSLARPAERFPTLFGNNEFLKKYPYFLPCAVPATFSALAWVVTFLFLKETVPSPTPVSEFLGFKKGKIVEAEVAEAAPSSPNVTKTIGDVEKPLPLRLLLTKRVMVAAGNYAALSLVDISFRAIQPLFLSTPIHLGGLGLPPSTIGNLLSIFGILNGVFQVFFFAKINDTWGSKNVFMFGIASAVPVFASFPLISYLAKAQGYSTWVWGVVGFQIVISIALSLSYGAIFIFISTASPNRASLGATNGLSQMSVSIMRAIGPAAANSLFSLSIDKGYLGGFLVYYVLLSIVAVSLFISSLLPRQVWTD
ncbi:hypothetical protein CVT25_012105 [Psilocybe cyanescens]|uniref:Major facilitator superfamily (MFS) profile domain-containing protein n=1 Tax=Psilocybe cyanescens TaxID=93625 RepID=A0A409VR22_PSICY|nr:hypothetical protein CVT25_012105 [Psilocybe cyanescens]